MVVSCRSARRVGRGKEESGERKVSCGGGSQREEGEANAAGVRAGRANAHSCWILNTLDRPLPPFRWREHANWNLCPMSFISISPTLGIDAQLSMSYIPRRPKTPCLCIPYEPGTSCFASQTSPRARSHNTNEERVSITRGEESSQHSYASR